VRRTVFLASHAGREVGKRGWRLKTATLDDVTKKHLAEVSAEQQAAVELVLLKQLTKTVLETALHER
jgi:hypothetical protein